MTDKTQSHESADRSRAELKAMAEVCFAHGCACAASFAVFGDRSRQVLMPARFAAPHDAYLDRKNCWNAGPSDVALTAIVDRLKKPMVEAEVAGVAMQWLTVRSFGSALAELAEHNADARKARATHMLLHSVRARDEAMARYEALTRAEAGAA